MTDLFGHSIRSEALALYVAEAVVGFAVAYALFAFGLGLADLAEAVPLAVTLAAISGLLSHIGGLYRPRTLSSANSLLLGTAVASLVLLLLLLPLLSFLAPMPARAESWRVLAGILVIFSLAVLLTRLGFASCARRGLFRRRLAVLRGVDIAPPAGSDAVEPFDILRLPPRATDLDLAELRAQRIWGVVATDPAVLPPTLRARCRQHRIRLFSAAEFRELRLNRVDIDALPATWLQAARATQDTPAARLLRRTFDLAAALTLLLFTLPLLLLTALAIKLDSPGPVFYRQERLGKDNRVFTLLKFRSMVVDAESGGRPRWASQHDPRVTRVGRLIRLTRIDEIPQVLNVLRGDMALVGPRPERPAFVEQLALEIPHYHDRAVIKPGITGWAQVNYPYGASVEDARMKLAYDLYYIRRRSFFLDLLIVLATIRVVLFQEGAR